MLLVGLVVCVGIVVGLAIFLFIPSSRDEETGGLKKPSAQQSETGQPAASTQVAPFEQAGDAPTGQPDSGAGATKTSAGMTSDPESHPYPSMPVISLPEAADSFDLEAVILPPLPYCIYTGAHKDFAEAATTQSELDSNYLAAYIVPVEIKGNVAQSLFGVTQDGLWYRVMTGHFSSKEEARKTLGIMMKELPGYQPEILRFPYTLECARFLDPEEARAFSEKLDRKDVFHYSQTYPTSDGKSLTRVVVGCFFSEEGAEAQAQRLKEKDLSCFLTDR